MIAEQSYSNPPDAANDNIDFSAPPTAANDNEERIDGPTGIMMLTVAIFSDVAAIASKVFILIGLSVLTAIGGAVAGDAVGDAEAGFFLGGIIGALISLTGVGTAAAFFVGTLMSEISSWLFALTGWSTMYLWFQMKGVPVLGGPNMEKRVATGIIAFVIDFVPFLNFLPGISIWTYTMIKLTRAEDKLARARRRVGYNRSTRRMTRTYANDNAVSEEDRSLAA